MASVKTIAIITVTGALVGWALVTVRLATEGGSSDDEASGLRSNADPPSAQRNRQRRPRRTFESTHELGATRRWAPALPRPTSIDPVPPSRAQPSPAELAEREAQESQYALEFHTRHHAQEPRDASWSHQHEEEISDHLAREAFAGNIVESIDCRTTQCRVVVTHQDADAAQRLHQAWGSGPFLHGGSSHFDERALSTILYLGREGYELPRPKLGPPPDGEE